MPNVLKLTLWSGCRSETFETFFKETEMVMQNVFEQSIEKNGLVLYAATSPRPSTFLYIYI